MTRKNSKQLVAATVCFTISISSAVVSTLSAAAAGGADNKIAAKPAASKSSLPKFETENLVEGAPFIDKMLKAADSYQDYVFEYEMTNLKGKKQNEKGKFYFKKPRYIRLEEVGNFRKGSIAVLGKGGKIKAKPGGALAFMTVDLPASSDYLKSANGYPMVDSDLTSLAQALKKFIQKDGCVARVSETPVLSASNDKVHILEIYHGSEKGEIFKRVAVDPQTMLPVEWWDYIGGQLSSHSTWNKFQGNVGLADEIFTIKGAKNI